MHKLDTSHHSLIFYLHPQRLVYLLALSWITLSSGWVNQEYKSTWDKLIDFPSPPSQQLSVLDIHEKGKKGRSHSWQICCSPPNEVLQAAQHNRLPARIKSCTAQILLIMEVPLRHSPPVQRSSTSTVSEVNCKIMQYHSLEVWLCRFPRIHSIYNNK